MKFRELVSMGSTCIESNDVQKLRIIVSQLYQIKLGGKDDQMLDKANILRG